MELPLIRQLTATPLVRAQKKMIRLIMNAGYRDHSTPLFKEANIIPFHDLYMYRLLRCTHSANKNCFEYLALSNLQSQNYNYPVRSQQQFKIPFVRHEYSRQSLKYTVPVYLNQFMPQQDWSTGRL